MGREAGSTGCSEKLKGGDGGKDWMWIDREEVREEERRHAERRRNENEKKENRRE